MKKRANQPMQPVALSPLEYQNQISTLGGELNEVYAERDQLRATLAEVRELNQKNAELFERYHAEAKAEADQLRADLARVEGERDQLRSAYKAALSDWIGEMKQVVAQVRAALLLPSTDQNTMGSGQESSPDSN